VTFDLVSRAIRAAESQPDMYGDEPRALTTLGKSHEINDKPVVD
jgi:hypothetical protein